MTRLQNSRAFTLIELIVVVVILGILAVIAAVGYNGFINRSRNTAAQADVTQIAKQAQATSADTNVAVAALPANTVAVSGQAGTATNSFCVYKYGGDTTYIAAFVTANATGGPGSAPKNSTLAGNVTLTAPQCSTAAGL